MAVREVHFSDPFAGVRAGDLDLAVLWRPVREADLTEGPVVFTEGRLPAVGTGHELAGRTAVTLEDFGGQTCVGVGPDVPGYWMESMVPARTPGGRPVARGPVVSTFHEVLHTVSSGQAVSPLNEHVVQYYSHPGIVLLPVVDAPPTEWALVWRTGDLHPRARALVDLAAALGPHSYAAPGVEP
ncbi:substrate-binding domain-containing protein [Dactylosporangium cerinum]|uniref:Substrate-binding domain-containing protein n=1 Tax=Dactylosporangium cerinum TaxID=1434730 RepID=A0ABV9WI84_9ACTN